VNCRCHGEPAYWQKDTRLVPGGWWECSVKRRARELDRYDRDPVHRITKNLRNDARKRRERLERRRAALLTDREGESHRSLPL
jgi:hypothetical protein